MSDDERYPRMNYGHDRREWVRMADLKLPGLIEHACRLQLAAKYNFEFWDSLSFGQKATMPAFSAIMRETNHDAYRALSLVIYYQGMREANRD